MPNRSERLEILNRLDKGDITPEEAAGLLSVTGDGSPSLPQTPMSVLEQLDRGEITPEEASRRLSSGAEANQRRAKKAPKVEFIQNEPPKAQRSQSWWLILIAVGALFAVLAGLWMRADLGDGSLGLGFFCAWAPMSIGVLLLLLGWFARHGPWANVNFTSRRVGGRVKADINMQVPIGIAGSVLHFVGDRVPALGREDVDRLVVALEQAGKHGEPIQIRTDSENGEDSVDITIS